MPDITSSTHLNTRGIAPTPRIIKRAATTLPSCFGRQADVPGWLEYLVYSMYIAYYGALLSCVRRACRDRPVRTLQASRSSGLPPEHSRRASPVGAVSVCFRAGRKAGRLEALQDSRDVAAPALVGATCACGGTAEVAEPSHAIRQRLRTAGDTVHGHKGPVSSSWNRRAMTGTSVGLVALIVVVTVGSLVTSNAARTSALALRIASTYGHAAAAIAAEESLERKYRLQPGPVPRAAHTAAEASLEHAMHQVAVLGASADRNLAKVVLREHNAYVAASAQLFLSVDRHDPVAVTNAIDTRTVDPVFGVMEAQVYNAAALHESSALSAAASVSGTGRLVVLVDLVTLLAAIGVVAAGALVVIRYQRDLHSESEHNRYQALHDPLTDLPNRTLFQDRTGVALRTAARSGATVAVLLLDLNRFKEVNDTLGHQYGDHLLLQVADRLRYSLREADSVARLGGDEFAILLPISGWDEALAATQRVGAALHDPFSMYDITLDVDASIGIALAEPGDDVETLLRHADVAMYEAKAAHHLFARYESSRDDNNLTRLVLLGDLRRAIAAGELTLHYQPKINARTGMLSSVEALVRWQHDTRGLLQPDEFIPLAESTAIIHALTTEVLRLALSQARKWADAGRSIPVAVNISARSLLDPSFPAQVQELLDAHGVAPHLLSLELTETAVMTDRDLALTVLRALDFMGVSLSIDDFGTGYSSMSYLKTLPVKELKIDRSFVMGMANDHDSAVIVRSAVDLGHNLGMTVVAEGVQDGITRSDLADMGCDLVQGYQICSPIPAKELELWIETHLTTNSSPPPSVHGDEKILGRGQVEVPGNGQLKVASPSRLDRSGRTVSVH
jgi:diguanylate cyclase (GGDEF)-like protein